ncbi:MAG TPA: phosphoadenylyl-sulfate reductase [Pseudomonadales bacterium]
MQPSPAPDQRPQEVLADAVGRFAPGHIAISFSGAEDVVLIDMAHQLGLAVDVFSLDTGRLHAETYRFIESVRNRYGVAIEMVMPEPTAVGELVKSKGLFSFYEDGHSECCGVRKIKPLKRKLSTLDAWITGQRQDQSVTRTSVPTEQEDSAFAGRSGSLVKFNPLAQWSSADVWAYIREHGVPYNPLHDRGFVSIGCEPCTRPVGPHEHERSGRWWWEEATRKECGLHAQNVVRIVG